MHLLFCQLNLKFQLRQLLKVYWNSKFVMLKTFLSRNLLYLATLKNSS